MIEQFREAIRSAGLEPPDVIEADGKLRRFASNGNRGDKAGWYVLYGDGIPAGSFGDWRTGVSESWRADIGRTLTPAEDRAHRAKVEAMRHEREAEDGRRKAGAASKAETIWQRAEPAPGDHPYLTRKSIKAHGARSHDGVLVVPMRDGAGFLHSLQLIAPDGEKRFLSGGRVAGCYFAIGDPNQTRNAGMLCIAEGFATGATIHEATGYPVAVAFNTGNLEPVARALRIKFPDLQLILCADDDAATDGNPGLTKATAAALAVAGKLAVPDFGGARPDGFSDFNDMAALCGAEAVTRAIAEARTPVGKSENESQAGNGQGNGQSGNPDVYREQVTHRANEITDLSVTVPDDIPQSLLEIPKTVDFPEAAWAGLFGQWRDMVGDKTEAPFPYLWAAFLQAVGLMVGRSVWRESPRPLYPNFFVLLLGQTGDSRKSTVEWFEHQLLIHLGVDVEILFGIVSTEGIIERLAQREGVRALAYSDEFRSLLSVAKRKGTQDILPRLQSLYSCPEKESVDRRQDPAIAIKPFFSLLAATPEDFIVDLIGDLEVRGGFLNRFLIITGQEQPPKPIVSQPTLAEWARLIAPLRRIQDEIDSNPQRMEFEPEAAELWTEFYIGWRKERRKWNSKAANLTARTFEHVLKISLVYSVLASERKISVPSMATAIKIGGWLESNALRLFGDAGLDHFGHAERIVLEILRRSKNGLMYRRDLQQLAAKKGVNGEVFGRVLKVMEANERVRVGFHVSGAGHKRPTVQHIREQEHLSPTAASVKVLPVPEEQARIEA